MAIESNKIEKFKKMEREREDLFRRFLDEQNNRENHVFAISSNMGITNSFITAAPLSWIATNVRFVKDMSFWKDKKDESGRLIMDETTKEFFRQRDLDWSRQIQMVRYLVERKNHKFPAIIVVAWKAWADNENADKWIDGRAGENSVTEVSLDSKGSFIDLDCENTQFYALDGQHRLMALKGLQQLLGDRSLPYKKGYGNGRVIPNQTLDLEEIKKQLDEPDIQGLLDEKMGIEIIPAVQKDDSRVEAVRRLRAIFVHVNREAKKLTKGQNIQLDDDDGFAVVAKDIMVSHSLLKDRVESKLGQLKDGASHYTTLETLVEITRGFLGCFPEFSGWRVKEKGILPLRPDDSELEKGLECMQEYFDLLSQLPSHASLIQDQNKSAGDFRDKGKFSTTQQDNVLFRPIAQIAFAEAIAELTIEKKKNFEQIVQVLVEHEQKGDLQLRDKKSIWFGVLCDLSDKNNMRKHKRYRDLCSRLLAHLLGGGTEDWKKLEEDFQKARQLDEATYVGLDGEHIKRIELIKLPSPW